MESFRTKRFSKFAYCDRIYAKVRIIKAYLRVKGVYDMSETIRIQDDLYMHVNKEWLDNAVIPADKPATGGFINLDADVEKLMIGDFNKMARGTPETPDENVKKAVRLFKLAKNVKRRNAEGLKPVQKDLDKIYNLKSISDLNRRIKDFVLSRIALPFGVGVDDDMKDTSRHAFALRGPSTILPDTTYYKEEMKAQHDALIGVWSQMVAELLKRTTLTETEQKTYLENALKFDAVIATLVKSSEEWSEYVKTYNPMPTRRVCTLLRPVKFKKLLASFYGERIPETIIVAEPRFLKGFSQLFNEETFELYKSWAYIDVLVSACGYLSEELRELASAYRKVLTGVNELPSIEKQAYSTASSLFSEPVGLYYGRKYFGEEAKKDVVEMVHEIIDTYKVRLERNGFLSEATKQKAILKLNKIAVKMGYPDECNKLYDKINFGQRASFYGAIKEILATRILDNFEKLWLPVDRSEWVMAGHVVNACYNPTSNDITFPAAILQKPFYSVNQSRSENLGGIGAVIGHEISHAFDNNGAKCDENGNLNNWWTKEDNKKFVHKTKAMIKEFEGIELEWGKVNASFIVSENIADNGGMAVTLEIMSNMENADYEAYFRNWARVWCLKGRPEYLKLLLQVDVHAPAYLRANMQPRNFDAWYETFNVKPTDKMYIAPKNRVVIW